MKPLLSLHKRIADVTVDDLREIYASLKTRERYATHPTRGGDGEKLSVHTLHKHVRTWKRFFRWLMSERIIDSDPAAGLKRPRLPRAAPRDLRPENLLKLLDAAKASSLRDYAIVCVLAGTGCRVGGLVHLDLDDVDLQRRTLRLREKGNKTRIVKMPERARDALMAYVAFERPADAGRRVFIGTRGALKESGVYLMLKRLARSSGVSGRSNPHAFRHAFAHDAIAKRYSPSLVQMMLGHERIETTLGMYGVFYDEEVLASFDGVLLPPDEDGDGRELHVQLGLGI